MIEAFQLKAAIDGTKKRLQKLTGDEECPEAVLDKMENTAKDSAMGKIIGLYKKLFAEVNKIQPKVKIL